jgi:hypothetical protein
MPLTHRLAYSVPAPGESGNRGSRCADDSFTQRGFASYRRVAIVEIGLAVGIEIETLREELDRDRDRERPGICCMARV